MCAFVGTPKQLELHYVFSGEFQEHAYSESRSPTIQVGPWQNAEAFYQMEAQAAGEGT